MLDTSYLPKSPDIAHSLAECAWARNLPREALILLVNLHKRAPDYRDIEAAY